MLCVPLGGMDEVEVRGALGRYECCELRLDLLDLAPGAVADLVRGAKARVVATCRPGELRDEAGRVAVMEAAVAAGAAWADVEIEAEAPYREAVVRAVRRAGSRLIVSVHDWENTPARDELLHLVDACFKLGADVAKLSCMARSPRDSARVLALYDDPRPIVAFCMGEAGKASRLASLFLGAPFTFASIGEGRGTAPGQVEYGTMEKLLAELGYEGR